MTTITPDPIRVGFHVNDVWTGFVLPVSVKVGFKLPQETVQQFEPIPSGPSVAYFLSPDFTTSNGSYIPPGTFSGAEETAPPFGPITISYWKTSRYLNKVGTFEVGLLLDDSIDPDFATNHPFNAGLPYHVTLRKGWHITVVQERTLSEHDPRQPYRIYLGVIQTKEYRSDPSGQGMCVLSGSLRSIHLADRWVESGLTFTGEPLTTIADVLVDGDNVIGPNGGVLLPDSATSRNIRETFYDKTRLGALIRTAELGRYAFRESWDHDKPELVPIDGSPEPGITLVNAVNYDPELDEAGRLGYGIISGTPNVRFDGSQIITRIEPIGADTHNDTNDTSPLTLAFSTKSDPYVIQSAPNPDGSTRYFLQDALAETLYGRVETRLVRSDVLNPNDDSTSRQQAANVLYAVGAGELLKHKSQLTIVDVPVANGANIWALPGDRVTLAYKGYVITPYGDDPPGSPVQTFWVNFHDVPFLVTERHDVSDPSGVRSVNFVLAAPEIQIDIPDLPGKIVLPPIDTSPGPLSPPISPFPTIPDCCDDPTGNVTDGAEQPPAGTGYNPEPAPEVPPPAVEEMALLPWSNRAWYYGGYAFPELQPNAIYFVIISDARRHFGDIPIPTGTDITVTVITGPLLLQDPKGTPAKILECLIVTGDSPTIDPAPYGGLTTDGHEFVDYRIGGIGVLNANPMPVQVTTATTFIEEAPGPWPSVSQQISYGDPAIVTDDTHLVLIMEHFTGGLAAARKPNFGGKTHDQSGNNGPVLPPADEEYSNSVDDVGTYGHYGLVAVQLYVMTGPLAYIDVAVWRPNGVGSGGSRDFQATVLELEHV